MANGGSGYYPGVDPDGKVPGGLISAGRFDAGALSILGTDIIPSVTSWGSWSESSGQGIPNAAITSLLFDTELQASSDIGYAAARSYLIVKNAGLYVILGEFNSDTIWASGKLTGSINKNAAGPMWQSSTNLYVGDGDQSNTLVANVGQLAANTHLSFDIHNTTGDVANLFCDLAIIRLA